MERSAERPHASLPGSSCRSPRHHRESESAGKDRIGSFLRHDISRRSAVRDGNAAAQAPAVPGDARIGGRSRVCAPCRRPEHDRSQRARPRSISMCPQLDGKLVAVSLSKGGSEDGSVSVFEVATGQQVPGVIPRVNGATAGGSLAWNADSTRLLVHSLSAHRRAIRGGLELLSTGILPSPGNAGFGGQICTRKRVPADRRNHRFSPPTTAASCWRASPTAMAAIFCITC